ncbi:MAG: hypothetical protein JO307_23605 [Bryobacterales bacterium]|nr:hypothetical protein [Bryobacterales bacterium]MBV9397458.1 hypothetical protein [Bryobacterales bacterium]
MESHTDAVFPQLTGGFVGFEDSEPEDTCYGATSHAMTQFSLQLRFDARL